MAKEELTEVEVTAVAFLALVVFLAVGEVISVMEAIVSRQTSYVKISNQKCIRIN